MIWSSIDWTFASWKHYHWQSDLQNMISGFLVFYHISTIILSKFVHLNLLFVNSNSYCTHFMWCCLCSWQKMMLTGLNRKSYNLFLDSCHYFFIATHNITYQKFWSGKANFPSLLNLPRQIEHFGKLWWYWEGNRKRFIQTIKSQILALRQAYSYYESKLSMITRLNSFCWIEEDLFRYKEEKELVDKLFHVYQNKHEILLCLELGKPISEIFIEGRLQIVFVSYSTGQYDIKFMPINFDPNSLSADSTLKITTTQLPQRGMLCLASQILVPFYCL